MIALILHIMMGRPKFSENSPELTGDFEAFNVSIPHDIPFPEECAFKFQHSEVPGHVADLFKW